MQGLRPGHFLKTAVLVALVAACFQGYVQMTESKPEQKHVGTGLLQPLGPQLRTSASTNQSASSRKLRAGTEALLKLPAAQGRLALADLLSRFNADLSFEDAQWFLSATQAEKASADGSWRLRKEDWLLCLWNWASNSPNRVAQFLETSGRLDVAKTDGKLLMEYWAKLDPRAVIAWATSDPAHQSRLSWLAAEKHALGKCWAERDLDDLLDYLNTGGTQVEYEPALKKLMETKDLEALKSWLDAAPEALPANSRSWLAMGIVQKIIAKSGDEAGIQWAASRPNPAEIEGSITTAASAYAKGSPQPAMQRLEALSSKITLPEAAWAAVMTQWAKQDAEAAGQWLNNHLDERNAPPLIWSYATEIMKDDPAAARAWAERLPESPTDSNLHEHPYTRQNLLKNIEKVHSPKQEQEPKQESYLSNQGEVEYSFE